MPYWYHTSTPAKLITKPAAHNTTIDIFKDNLFFKCVNMFPIMIIIKGRTGIRYLGPHAIAPLQANGSNPKDNVPTSNQFRIII